MKLLAGKKDWDDSFKDQLHCEYKDWLYSAVSDNLANQKKAKAEQDAVCNDQFDSIGREKLPIKKKVAYQLDQKERGRLIESKNKRMVHFLFKSGLSSKLSMFGRDFLYFMANENKLDAIASR